MRDTRMSTDCTRRIINGKYIRNLVKLFIWHQSYHVKIKSGPKVSEQKIVVIFDLSVPCPAFLVFPSGCTVYGKPLIESVTYEIGIKIKKATSPVKNAIVQHEMSVVLVIEITGLFGNQNV